MTFKHVKVTTYKYSRPGQCLISLILYGQSFICTPWYAFIISTYESKTHRCFLQSLIKKHKPCGTYLSGMRKCRRDQSSLREFCRGVPVISSLWLDLKSISVLYSSESSFFSRWASSTPRKAQFMFPKTPCTNKNTTGINNLQTSFTLLQNSLTGSAFLHIHKSCTAYLVFQQNLICSQKRVELDSFGLLVDPLVVPNLREEKSVLRNQSDEVYAH